MITRRKAIQGIGAGAVALTAGGILAPEARGLIMLGGSATSSPGQPFDFYISTTGSDTNAGTLASPWAITAINTKQATYAGKRLGIIGGTLAAPVTYDVSSLMGTNHSPALTVNGGPNSSTPTYLGTSDASGHYSPRTVVLDAMGASGQYGGGNSNNSTIIGIATLQTGTAGGPTPPNWGNVIIDGLVLTNWSAWALQVGSFDSSGGNVPNVTIQNCEIHGGNASNHNVSGAHVGAVELYTYTNCTMQNCYIHDNISPNSDNSHYAAITVWGGVGAPSTPSSGLILQLCTIYNSGIVYGIYDTGIIYDTLIQQNFIDISVSTPKPFSSAVEGFGNSGSTGLAGSIFRNNIFRGGFGGIDTQGQSAQEQWASPAQYYNNTVDFDAGTLAVGLGFRFMEASGKSAIFSCYNNLCWDNGANISLGEYGYNSCNVDGFSVCDYNIYGTGNKFTTWPAGSSVGDTVQTFASWKTAIGNLDQHSITNSTNPFTNGGTRALGYLVQSGSVAFGAGRVGGVSAGAAVNCGAWDGIVTQIGSVINGVYD